MVRKRKKIVKRKRVKRKKPVKRKVTRKKRKTSKKLVEKPEVFYMGISDPVEIRRTILEGARDMVHFLQLFEKFRVVREEKKEAAKILRKHVKELNVLVNKLKKELPNTSLRAVKPKKVAEPSIEEGKEPEKIKVLKETPAVDLPDIGADDIEALEVELRDIEDKLSFL